MAQTPSVGTAALWLSAGARFWAEGCSPGTGLAAVRGPSRRHGSQDRTEAGPASADALGRSKPLNPLCAFSHLSPQPKCDGQALLTRVWERVNLIECDYFGLEFQNAPSCWVRASRLAWRQAAGVHTRCRARRACEDLSGDTTLCDWRVTATRAAPRTISWVAGGDAFACHPSPTHILPTLVACTGGRSCRALIVKEDFEQTLQAGQASSYLVDEPLKF